MLALVAIQRRGCIMPTWDNLRELWAGENYKVVVSQKYSRSGLYDENAVIHVKKVGSETTLCGCVPKHRWSKHRSKASRYMTQGWYVMKDFGDALDRMGDDFGHHFECTGSTEPSVCPRCFPRFKKRMDAEAKAYSEKLEAYWQANGRPK